MVLLLMLIAPLFTSVGDRDSSSSSLRFLNIDGVVNRELDLGELPSYAEHSGHAFRGKRGVCRRYRFVRGRRWKIIVRGYTIGVCTPSYLPFVR